MNFRSEVSIDSTVSVADLKTSYSVTGAKLQTNFKVLFSLIASLKKIIDGDFTSRVRMDDL